MTGIHAKRQGVSVGVVPVSDLAATMARASSEAARATLLNYTSDLAYVKLRTALEVGAAVEWLVRAVLARLSPALIALQGHHDSILVLSGARALGNPLNLRTNSMSDALKILFKAHPAMVSLEPDINFIMDVRNGAAHSGLVAATSLEEATRKLVRIADALLGEVGLSRNDFWGSGLIDVATGISADFDDYIAARISSKIAAAKARFNELVAGIPNTQLEQSLTVLESRHPSIMILDDTKDVAHECPACERRAWVTYLRQQGEEGSLEFDFDRDGYPESAYVAFEVTLIPIILQCPVCGLALEAQRNELAGLAGVKEHDDELHYVDASEYYADQEPY